VALNWGASSTDGVAYNIFRGTSSGGEGTTPIDTSAITSLTYTDTNVTRGADYDYMVKLWIRPAAARLRMKWRQTYRTLSLAMRDSIPNP
jgi:hypothetical protein